MNFKKTLVESKNRISSLVFISLNIKFQIKCQKQILISVAIRKNWSVRHYTHDIEAVAHTQAKDGKQASNYHEYNKRLKDFFVHETWLMTFIQPDNNSYLRPWWRQESITHLFKFCPKGFVPLVHISNVLNNIISHNLASI